MYSCTSNEGIPYIIYQVASYFMSYFMNVLFFKFHFKLHTTEIFAQNSIFKTGWFVCLF